ncbi:MAG TPA: HD domain-containing protein [Streptosporangiaceae bacterium]|nr:HD domain-containing protein [Streptosporangiaceae bacterium]
MNETTRFLYELGLLKRYPRTGWLQLGVRTPESVADHSFRASVVATVLASAEGADPQRAAFLALWHDSQETRTTDLPHLAQRYVTSVPHDQITDDQVRPLPPALARLIREAVAEYEAGQTPEARCARDADKLEMLLQAREYEAQGHRDVQPFLDSALNRLHTATGRKLAEEALAEPPLGWLDHTRPPGPPPSPDT